MKNIKLYRKYLTVLGIDTLMILAGWYCAHLLRYNFVIPKISMAFLLRCFPIVIVIKIIVFYYFDLYRGMWRYTSIDDLFNIIKASSIGTLFVFLFIATTHGFSGIARSILIIDWFLTIISISAYRLGVRLFFWFVSEKYSTMDISEKIDKLRGKKAKDAKRLLIVGAGDCGEKIFREIRDNAGLKYEVVAFVDDDVNKLNKKIHGIPIAGEISELKTIAEKFKTDESLIAISSRTSMQMRQIVSICEESGIPFKTLPGMGELIDGKVTVNAIRKIDYKDLLWREIVRLEEDRIGEYIEDAMVLVSGAGGSIGSELCRQICRFRPRRLILYERAESALYEIEIELKQNFPSIEIISMLADIRDRRQISYAYKTYKPQVVFHAAAYKHVPMMELHPWKAVKNNILGTRNMVDISKEFSVERFVFVSTDKAVRPTNIMGTSKRVAELIVQGQNNCHLSDKKFMTVRFGNVVGSVGSVGPLFKKQIASGGPVTVTHPEVTRYFMTIPEACQLILQAGAMGKGGETFLLDMGTPVKIVDMARDMIRLSGFEPDVDIKIEFTGLRPGEKLYEELITEGEDIETTSHEKIMVLRGNSYDQIVLNGCIDELGRLAHEQDSDSIRAKLCEIVPEFKPMMEVADIKKESIKNKWKMSV